MDVPVADGAEHRQVQEVLGVLLHREGTVKIDALEPDRIEVARRSGEEHGRCMDEETGKSK